MNGPLAQIVAMTSHANAEIGGDSLQPFSLNNSTAMFCNKISYIDWIRKKGILSLITNKNEYKEKCLADDFIGWTRFLKQENVKQLFLHYVSSINPQVSDRITAGFVGGGGRWLIEAWKGTTSDYWEAKWEVTNQEAKDRRIWSVTYARISRNNIVRKTEHSGLSGIEKGLKKSVLACQSFAKRYQMDIWKASFDNAVECLDSGETDFNTIYHKDIIPLGKYSDKAKRILFAAQSTWVFGGMGSWNDMGIWNDKSFDEEEQKHYEKISDQLFSEVCKAITHATNEYGKIN
jgi:hypothetical protein